MAADPPASSIVTRDIEVKVEIKEEPDDDYDNMVFMEFAECIQTDQEPIDVPATVFASDPTTGLTVCLHCLEHLPGDAVSEHMTRVHGYRRILFKCHMCQTQFLEKKVLISHRVRCRPPSNRCKRKSFRQLITEIDSIEPDGGQASCPVCMLELPKFCLKAHFLAEHKKPEVLVTCEICQRQFKSKMTLKEHVKLVHEAVEDSEECEQCGQKFRSQKYLANHRRNVHPTGNKVHKCEVCGKEFRTRLSVHQHTKHVHPPAAAATRCAHCRKQFKSRVNLRQHLKVAHGDYNKPE